MCVCVNERTGVSFSVMMLKSVCCGLWCPHWPLSLSSLVCVRACVRALYPHLTGDLDGHWWDHASWHSSEASPMSLVRHVEPCLDMTTPLPPSLPPSLPPTTTPLPPLPLSAPPTCPSPVSCHFMFPSLYLHLCMLFFCFSFCFYPTPVGDSQRGKRKTIEQTFMSEPTHTLSERQKKMVRFGGHSFEEDLAWCEPQVKDSGVDTCSSTTLNEEHSHSEKVLRQPSLHFVVIYDLPIQSLFALCH